jgi:hypothetical protein
MEVSVPISSHCRLRETGSKCSKTQPRHYATPGSGSATSACARATLDDVFLQLTGTPPSENGATPQTSWPADEPTTTTTRRRPSLTAGVTRQLESIPHLSSKAVRADLPDMGVVTAWNLRHFIRQPELLIFSTIQPVMFVLLSNYMFGGTIHEALPHGVSYIDFLFPGIFMQSVAFRVSMPPSVYRRTSGGSIDRFRSMPMARSAVLIGRATADLVRHPDRPADDRCGIRDRLQFPSRVPPSTRMDSRARRFRSGLELDLRVRGADREAAQKQGSRPATW